MNSKIDPIFWRVHKWTSNVDWNSLFFGGCKSELQFLIPFWNSPLSFFFFLDELKYIIEERKPRTEWEFFFFFKKKRKRKKEASSLTTAQKGRRGGSYSQHQNFQGSITRFGGSKKLNKIHCLLLSTTSAVKRPCTKM